MNFAALKTTRVLAVAGIGIAVTVVAAVVLALVFKTDNPGLANRLSSSRTVAYVRTTDRDELLRWAARLQPLAPGPDAKGFLVGDLYELAYVKQAPNGYAWVLATHDVSRGTERMLVSDPKAEVLLPVESEEAPLLRTFFFSEYVSRMTKEAVWLRPEALSVKDAAAAHVLEAAMFGGTHILLLPRGQGRGKLVIDGNVAGYDRRTPSLLPKQPDDVLWMSVGGIGRIAAAFDKTLTALDPETATGLRGIAAAWAMSRKFDGHRALLSTPLSFAVRRTSGSTLATIAAGTLPSVHELARLKTTLAAAGAEGTVRNLALVENVRRDVIAEGQPSSETVGAWTVTELGGSPALFFAERGADAMVSTDKPTLLSALEKEPTADGPLSVSLDLGYAYGELGRAVPFLGEPLTQVFGRLFGPGVSRLDLRAASLSPTLVLEWEIL